MNLDSIRNYFVKLKILKNCLYLKPKNGSIEISIQGINAFILIKRMYFLLDYFSGLFSMSELTVSRGKHSISKGLRNSLRVFSKHEFRFPSEMIT